ncbi:MAG TPA: hypothetical protein VKA95_15925 [Nitrososphaeraceae archaeon]|nr:hypothetical protein [Nitrososphaeraceae archaeon]
MIFSDSQVLNLSRFISFPGKTKFGIFYVKDSMGSIYTLCVIGMVIGIGLISALPLMGLTCRWCTAGG